MTKKEYKPKYQPQPEDMNATGSLNRQKFVARIVNTENRAMNAKEVHALINNKVEVNRGRTHENTQANLSDAVRSGRLDKTRTQVSETKSEVVYHPTNMKPMGLDIPVPLFTRDTKDNPHFSDDDDVFTFDDDEEEANECWKCGSIVAMEDTVVEGTKSFCSSCAIPAPVKVAEKVIADIAGLPADGPTVSATVSDNFTPINHHEIFAPIEEKKEDFVAFMERRKREKAEAEKVRLAGLSSTIQHHFTAEQLLDTLNALNPDLHDDVLVAMFDAVGKDCYLPIGDMRKTTNMTWTFVNGNLVVKQ